MMRNPGPSRCQCRYHGDGSCSDWRSTCRLRASRTLLAIAGLALCAGCGDGEPFCAELCETVDVSDEVEIHPPDCLSGPAQLRIEEFDSVGRPLRVRVNFQSGDVIVVNVTRNEHGSIMVAEAMGTSADGEQARRTISVERGLYGQVLSRSCE